MCGHHNHELAETLVGHPYAGRLNTSEKSLLVDMTKSKVTPANILLTLKQNNDRNVTTIKQIYNARHAYKRSLRGSITELQQLMMLLDRDKYIHWSRCADDSKVVTDLFWTHPDAVKLLNSFNVVFMMDYTYKTNRYRLPLLEIVGMTSTGLTFSAAFAFLSTERQSNFTWALEKLKGLFLTSEGGPKVIVTDRDLALMNAISSVFPESYQMLCRFHILKNVKAKCKMLVHSTEVWEVLMDAWENVMDCADESLFAEYVNGFEYASRSWPLFFEYVNQNWIIPYSTYFVKFWTNKVMHLGNTTTNRYVVMLFYLFEYVDAFHSTIEYSSVRSKLQSKPKAINKRRVPMIDQFHSTTHPFIVDVVDVVADGHCGYRCIAALLGLGEDSWPVVRNELYKELSSWRDEYASLVGGYDRLEELRTSLLVQSLSAANKSKWMTLPDIGYAIANRYNVILVCLSYSQSYTIFPLRSTPPSDITQHRLICIGHVHGCHFVQVKLQECCPLPTVNIMSSTHCYPEARAWSSIYTSRMHAFEQLMDITTSYVDLGDS
ncbi:protein FAR1-RELATED SEQUENCE 5-like isoform X1 [Vigna angularis]|uniref:protein FAR1-RELATED SEQUENCE 5-like isoform X1 n=1 Tax=Phaseolus angularis TaxID=3914 RepID=UPI0022B547BD|nr:protein FAR1-RELATED SEQUENCE 5-like isoform X1 [Vigna angularis]